MAIAKPRRLKGPGHQLELDGKIQDARFAAVPALDEWRRQQEERANQRWLELQESRQPCRDKAGRCSAVAVIWCATWNIPGAVNPVMNAAYCLKHWPAGEGRALQSSHGWTRDGRGLADLGWRPDRQWGPVGVAAPTVHKVRGDLGGEC